jgi:hypothetical protein
MRRLAPSLVVVASLLAVAGAQALTVGAPANVTKLAGHQSEPTIQIQKTAPTKLFATSNQLPTGVAAAGSGRKSTDSGATWTNTAMALPFAACCDYQTAADGFGNIFLTYLDPNALRVMLEVSTDGGATWAAVTSNLNPAGVIDSGPNMDQPAVAVGGGSVWVYWDDNGQIKARGAPVTGAGNANIGNFIAEEATPSTGNFGDVAVGPTGIVAVTYQSDTTIFTNTDADGLGPGGFGATVVVATTNVDRFDAITPQPNRTIDAEANLDYDQSGGANNGRLYLVYTDETPDESNNTDIFVRTSTNNGASWSAAVKVNDDVTQRAQFFPDLEVDQSSGKVAVTWYDARNDCGTACIGNGSTDVAANDDTQYWGALSTNGGLSFGPNFRISAGNATNGTQAVTGNPNEYGDYSRNDYFQNKLYPVWGDNTNSTGDNPNGAGGPLDIYTAQIDTSSPTGVGVAGASATRTARGVAVTWRTESEVGIAGFDVYRAVAGRAVKVNAALVPAKHAGRPMGARYRVVDPAARAGLRYTYRVQVVLMDGRTEAGASAGT